MLVRRPPCASLAPFVEALWATDGGGPASAAGSRERIIPNGCIHIAVRVGGVPVRVFGDEHDAEGSTFLAVVGGPRSRYHVRDATPAASVGVQFRPGGATALLGVPAELLAERHSDLGDLWRSLTGVPQLDTLLARLAEEDSLASRLELVEAALGSRLAVAAELHPAVRLALRRFDADGANERVGAVREETGYSHRRFVELFRREIGLSPKVYCRVRRLQRAVERAAALPWVEVAAVSGYADQAHLTRELRAIAGVAPGDYRRASPPHHNHVPLSGRPRGAEP